MPKGLTVSLFGLTQKAKEKGRLAYLSNLTIVANKLLSKKTLVKAGRWRTRCNGGFRGDDGRYISGSQCRDLSATMRILS